MLRRYLISLIILFTTTVSAQYDVNIRINESNINELFRIVTDAHGLNYGEVNHYSTGLQAWYGNLDNATVNINTNNNVQINTNFAVVGQISLPWFGSFPSAIHVSPFINGSINIVGSQSDGYTLRFDPGHLVVGPLPLTELPDIDVNIGSELLPNWLSGFFTTSVPQLTTTSSEIVAGFNVAGSDYMTITNNINGTNNSGVITVAGQQKYAPHSKEVSGSVTLSAIDQVVDGKTYVFSNWSTGSSSRTISVSSPGEYVANFTQVLAASITGPTSLQTTQNGTYTCSASGGSTPYSYQWQIKYLDVIPPEANLTNDERAFILNPLPGAPPSGTWFNVGSNSSTFVRTAPINGDYRTFQVRCKVTDNASELVTSNIITTHYVGGAKKNDVEEEQLVLKHSVGNYPNPFNPQTTISYTLPEPSNVSLKIYNSIGKEVTTLVNGYENAGSHQVSFDGNTLASGIYFYVFQAGSFHKTGKMLLLK